MKLLFYSLALPAGWLAGALYYNLIAEGYISAIVALAVSGTFFLIGKKIKVE